MPAFTEAVHAIMPCMVCVSKSRKDRLEVKRQEICDGFVCLPFKKASQEGCSLIIAILIEKFCLLQRFLGEIKPWCSCPDILRTVVFLQAVFIMLITHE